MEDKRRVILILNIKVDSLRNEDLVVYENDEPEVAAAEFCRKFSMPDSVKELLTKKIEENLDVFIEEELGNSMNHLRSFASNAKTANISVSSHKRSCSSKNYGEVLYEKGIMMKQKVENMVQVQKQTLLEKEMENLTFTPKINTYMKKSRNVSSGYANKRAEKVNEELNICTFKPKINKYRSKGSVSNEKKDKCLELFNKAGVIKQKIEEKNRKM